MELGVIFAALVWWEFIGLGIIAIVMFMSLFHESSLVTAGALLLIFLVPWSGTAGVALLSGVSIWGILAGIAGYLVIGTVWSLWKWRLLAIETKRDLKRDAEKYPNSYQYSNEEVRSRLSSKKNNDVIGFWIVFWVFSVIAATVKFLFSDMIGWIIDHLGGVYDRITESVLR